MGPGEQPGDEYLEADLHALLHEDALVPLPAEQKWHEMVVQLMDHQKALGNPGRLPIINEGPPGVSTEIPTDDAISNLLPESVLVVEPEIARAADLRGTPEFQVIDEALERIIQKAVQSLLAAERKAQLPRKEATGG